MSILLLLGWIAILPGSYRLALMMLDKIGLLAD